MSNQKNIFQEITNNLSWLFIFQGLSFIGLGILIHLRPATLVDLVVIAFGWMGISALVSSWKIRKLGRDITADISELTKK